MKIPTILILFCITTVSLGQSTQIKNSRFLTYRQNKNWLTETKSLDKVEQLTAIEQRFFDKKNENTSIDSIQYSPMILVNGVPLNIPDKLTKKYRTDILNLLTEESVKQIAIIDKTPDNWTFHKPFSGAIILTVDKKTDKRLIKLKLG